MKTKDDATGPFGMRIVKKQAAGDHSIIIRDKSSILNRKDRLFDIKPNDKVYIWYNSSWNCCKIISIANTTIKVSLNSNIWSDYSHDINDMDTVKRVKSI